MASISKEVQTTKDGRRFWKISVSRGYGKSPYTERFYWPTKADGHPVSKSTAERELKAEAARFENACANGEVQSRSEAKEKAAQEAAEAAKLKTVRQYADNVFMATKETTLSENGRSSYRMFLDKHILPVLGNFLLVEVTPAMITKLLADFQKRGYAHASAVKLYNILNGLFEMAFMDDSIPCFPMIKVKRPAARKDEKVKDEADKALTAKELNHVLSCVAQEPLKWRAYITLAADSGARRGELCGLQWQDIEWKSGEIVIRRNLQYTTSAGVYTTTPKNGKVRTVDVAPETLALLKQLREEQAASCISQWVFTQDGTVEPMFPQTPTRYFQKFGSRYGIENFHPHLLRHTSASLMVTSGADLKSVADRLGHSEAVLLRKYAHANKDSIRRAGQSARDALKAENE